MKNLNIVDWIALSLVVAGALNWGLVSAFGVDPSFLFGDGSIVANIVYDVIAVAGVYLLVSAIMGSMNQTPAKPAKKK